MKDINQIQCVDFVWILFQSKTIFFEQSESFEHGLRYEKILKNYCYLVKYYNDIIVMFFKNLICYR